MKLAFILPALGLHQLELSNNLYALIGNDFCFIATEKIELGRFGLNYDSMSNSYPYVLKAYDSDENSKKAKDIILQSDCIVIGSCPEVYAGYVNKNDHALILRYSERLFKRGKWRRFIPSVSKTIKKHFLSSNSRLAAICSSAYLPYDLSLFDKSILTFKWGYFPKVYEYNTTDLFEQKKQVPLILWAGRMVKCKHPDHAVQVARMLNEKGFQFQMKLVGNGKLKPKLAHMIFHYNLTSCVSIVDAMDTQSLQKEMVKSSIFLFTSDFQEGWGAILNEAMNAGCACVASHAPGSVPFVIQNQVNGLIYQNQQVKDLCRNVEFLIKNPDKAKMIGQNAYYSIIKYWNPEIAAKRLVQLSEEWLKSNSLSFFDDGPLSEASIIKNNWYKE